MPSPVGHALGGAIVALAAARGVPSGSAAALPLRRLLVVCATAACLPDVDFLWGRHNMETHSVGFAALVGVGVFAWWRSPRLALAAAGAVLTHVLFDWLGSDDAAPLGVMALWPFSSAFLFAHAFVFEAISRLHRQPGFVRHNLLAIAREVLLLGPIAGLSWWWYVRRTRD